MDNLLDAPQPILLSFLKSSIIGRNLKLNWATASENNNSGFDVERKIISDNWVNIGFVQGKGNSVTTTSYSYEDKNLQTGKYKYRLKQIDNNGNFEYFELNGDVEIGIPKKFDLSQNYPNPFNPTTKINFDLPVDAKVSLVVYDITGREVAKLLNNEFRPAGYHTTEFNASKFSSGVYFYSLSTNNFRMTKKMILTK
ncbi:T9SS C-terminal target domain-containing protein [bacterium]|nr:MAG: T9SS C-terminal target domain-containing protein [bacterium]